MAQMTDRARFRGDAVHLDWPAPGVALVTLDRPDELNALSLTLIKELWEALALAEQSSASAVILTGAGRAFCAGADLKLLTSHPMGRSPMRLRDEYLAPLAKLFDSFEERTFPIIAAINGYALGGGCEMALSADLRLMSRGAYLGLPEVALGAIPGAGGVQKLIRHVGRAKALEWIMLGCHISAEEAERRGLLVEVTEEDQLLPRAVGLAKRMAELGPAAIAQAKMSVYVAEDSDLRTARRFGIEALTTLAATAEWSEGVTAFVEKRKPRFR
jgi:enoyl-CoA hydratase/carnithine racemase